MWRGLLGFMALGLCLGALAEGTLRTVPDAYASIQAAIDAAQPGDTVQVTAGQYEGPIAFKDNIQLTGEGADKVCVVSHAPDAAALTASGCASGRISGIAFEQTYSGPLAPKQSKFPAAIALKGSSLEISACTGHSMQGDGLSIAGRSTPSVRDCAFDKNGGCGIYLNDGTEATVGNTQCTENGRSGILLTGRATAPILTGNRCLKNQKDGICFEGGATGDALKNVCSENAGSGIRIHGPRSYPDFTGNECRGNLAYGIGWDENSRATVKDCVLEGNGWIGDADVAPLLEKRAFDQLEAWVARLRQEKTGSLVAHNNLAAFYGAISPEADGLSAKEADAALERQEAWVKAYPKSLAARVGLAGVHVSIGWKARGTGYANEVPKDKMKKFTEEIAKAWDILQEAGKLEEKDPALYTDAATVAMWMGLKNAGPLNTLLERYAGFSIVESPAEKNFNAGLALNPLYRPLYNTRVYTLLPRWGGHVTQMARLAQTAPGKVPPEHADILYACLAERTAWFEQNERYWSDYGYSWERVRKGLDAILKTTPEVEKWEDRYLQLACVFRDKTVAGEWFKRIEGSRNPWKWSGAQRALRRWALDGAGYWEEVPLVAAIREENDSEVKRLLESGSDPNEFSINSQTMLQEAVIVRSKKILNLLLDHGADPNLESTEEWPPLAEAVAKKFPELAELLIARGANPQVLTREGESLMTAALRWDSPDIARLLLAKGCDPNLRRRGTPSPLMRAIATNDMELARDLLARGADVHAVTRTGWDTLHEAAETGRADWVRLLLDRGVDVNQRQKDGWAAVHQAASSESPEALNMLLTAPGINIRVVDEDGETPLHTAARKGRTEAVRALLKAGAEVNARDSKGNTPLTAAKNKNKTDAAALLAQNGGTE